MYGLDTEEEYASKQFKARSGRGAHDLDNCALCLRAECRIYARTSTHTKCATHLLSILITTYQKTTSLSQNQLLK